MHSRLGAAALLLATLLPADIAAQSLIEGDGAAQLGVALRRLGTTKRVLMIAAHPDDENTALIAELALGDGANVAYLSLTRGEGGQNLIGSELQEGLGLIRTEELLAARRLDGALQFFTRAYDYGFSKSAEEAFSQWPRDSLLSDVVSVIRRYRPDILVAVFSGTPADGHGQHQAAGIMAREAFVAAGDPARFPEQLERGLRPHAPRYLFQALYRPPEDVTLRLSTGELDPLFGRSRYQIAMQSRSRHRSQDMGRGEPLGPQSTMLNILAGAYPADGTSLFADLDTTLSQHGRSAGAPDDVVRDLLAYEDEVARLRASYNPLRTAALAPALAAAVRRLDAALPRLTDSRLTDLRRRIDDERAQAAAALRFDAGVVVDVLASTATPVAGTSFELAVTVWNGGPRDVELVSITPAVPRGWTASGDTPSASVLAPGRVLRRTYLIDVPANANATEPYFLRGERTGAMYSWKLAPDSVRGLPFESAAVGADIALDIGAPIHVSREAEFALVDKAVGEIRQPLIVVPAASVMVEPRVAAIPSGDVAPRSISVTVSAARDSVDGVLRLVVPTAWRVTPASADVRLVRAGDSRTVEFTVTPPADTDGEHILRAAFESGGRVYDEGYSLIDYPHIRPHLLYHAAQVRAAVFPVRIADGLRIGYIEGAGDDGAAALAQLGADVTLLDAVALANGDLSRYDAIVAGIRAYEVRPDIISFNARLLDYVRGGGTFVVQYNKYELVEGGFMPYPATMSRPHGRVTDEHAAVALLEPEHPALSWPNRITPADFDGWVHERGLYYLDTFDSRYDALLSMADPGEDPETGSLVAARVGEGWYVYAGLAFFRQLPEAVPGAYQLLANLVSLGNRERM